MLATPNTDPMYEITLLALELLLQIAKSKKEQIKELFRN